MRRETLKQDQHAGGREGRAAILGLILILARFAKVSNAQQAGGVAASGPRVKMVRGVAGTKGEQRGGTFVMSDPRTTFFVPDDRQVIVYFEWESVRGTHHCEGTALARDEPGGKAPDLAADHLGE